MKKWKPERRDGLLLLGIGLGAAVGLLRGAVLAWLPVGGYLVAFAGAAQVEVLFP